MLASHRTQAGFCPYALREVSILAEPTIGRLRCLLVGVPPQPSISPGAVPNKVTGAALHVWVSHLRLRSPLPPPWGRRRNTWLMQSSTGSSLPAILSKPVPLAVFSPGSRLGQSRPRCSFMRAANQAEWNATLRLSGVEPPSRVASPAFTGFTRPHREGVVSRSKLCLRDARSLLNCRAVPTCLTSALHMQRQPFSRSSRSILPNSLICLSLPCQRLLALGSCCGFRYGACRRVYDS